MRIKCKSNNLNKLRLLSDKMNKLIQSIYHIDIDEVDLTIDEIYVCYAIRFSENNYFFCIKDDNFAILSYPVFYPSDLFEVVDEFIPKDWNEDANVFSDLLEKYSQANRLCTFTYWKNNKTFYERLIDGDKQAQQIFNYHAKLIEK
jgi:hypothetical protein